MADDGDVRYNVRYVDLMFPSRSVTETLLGPERETGNVTDNDYEAAKHFFSNFHRSYRVCLLFALSASYSSSLISILGPW